MSYCLNPLCSNPSDPSNANNLTCCHCGSDLLLQERYRVVRLLGEGGFGKTFEVSDGTTSKVLKVLTNNHPKAVSLFQQEAKVLSCLRHPGIPRVEANGYFIFQPKNSNEPLHYLVMEKIEGLDLLEWLKQRDYKPINQTQAIAWLKQLAIILGQVHQQQYFHRDIKPSNIIRRLDGKLVLIDFGTAREVTSTYLARIGGGHQVTGLVSAGYTPPEQVDGRAVPQSDFYALGRTFVHLLTGRPPNNFAEDLIRGQLMWRKNAKHISNPLADLIDRLMEPLPGNRPQDTKEILQCIKAIESSLNSPRPPTVRVQRIAKRVRFPNITLQKLPKKRRWRALTILALALLVIALVGKLSEFWPGKNPLLLRTISVSEPVISVAISPDGKTLVSGSDSSSVTFLPKGKFIVRNSGNNKIQIWNLYTGRLVRTIFTQYPAHKFLISPDGQTLVSSNMNRNYENNYPLDSSGNLEIINVWNLKTGQRRYTLSDNSERLSSALGISPDGKTLFSRHLPKGVNTTETIKIWNLETGQLIRTLNTPANTTPLDISIYGNTLIVTGAGSISLLNPRNGQLISTFTMSQTGMIRQSAISPDGQTIAYIRFDSLPSSSSRRKVMIWNLRTGQSIGTLDNGRPDILSSIAFSPDGQTLASGGGRGGGRFSIGRKTIEIQNNGMVDLWNVRTGQLTHTFTGYSSLVISVAFSPDGKILAGGSVDKTIKVWRVR
jgi:serine/threonine protein kinase